MFNAKYRIELRKEAFLKKSAACLGEQFLQLLDFLEQTIVIPHTWFAADLDVSFSLHYDYFKKLHGSKLHRIEIDYFKYLTKDVPQFLSGVLFAIQNNSTVNESLDVGTDEERFRPLNIEGIVIEIRAFDTYYFDLYSDDYEIMKAISTHFNALISSQ